MSTCSYAAVGAYAARVLMRAWLTSPHAWSVPPHVLTVYEGSWSMGQRHGNGVHTTRGGDVYRGSFHAHERSDHGLLEFADGSVYAPHPRIRCPDAPNPRTPDAPKPLTPPKPQHNKPHPEDLTLKPSP
jgi:hypothetical protein